MTEDQTKHDEEGESWMAFRQVMALGVKRSTLSHWKQQRRIRCRIGTDGYNEYLSSDVMRLIDTHRSRKKIGPQKTYAVADVGLTMVKVGRTVDLAKRLSDLQAASPVELILVAVANRDIERKLHKRLRRHRRHSEWFEFNKIVESKIGSAMRLTPTFRALRGAP
jgi:hypothetical protein